MNEVVHMFLRHSEQARFIFESNTSWEFKYHRIFNTWRNDIKPLLDSLNDTLNWYDPDTSYEDDIKSFMEALSAKQTAYAEAFIAENPDIRYVVLLHREGRDVGRLIVKGHGDQLTTDVRSLTDDKEERQKDARFINGMALAIRNYIEGEGDFV
jgi:hypothetical protein